MSLKKCRECGAQVSSKAVACPGCGAVRKSTTGNVGCGGCVAGVGCLVLALCIIGFLLLAIMMAADEEKKRLRVDGAAVDSVEQAA